jgi:hypothetical protein
LTTTWEWLCWGWNVTEITRPRVSTRPRETIIPPNSPIRVGRVKRAITRAFIALGCPISTTELMKRAYPRGYGYESWQYATVRLAARAVARPIGRSERGKGRPWLWAPRETAE